jgi:hypothetical protein
MDVTRCVEPADFRCNSPIEPQLINSDLPATSLPRVVAELEACFVVVDNIGQKIAFVCFAHEAERRSETKLFSKDEARRTAANVVAGITLPADARFPHRDLLTDDDFHGSAMKN